MLSCFYQYSTKCLETRTAAAVNSKGIYGSIISVSIATCERWAEFGSDSAIDGIGRLHPFCVFFFFETTTGGGSASAFGYSGEMRNFPRIPVPDAPGSPERGALWCMSRAVHPPGVIV